MKSRDIARSWSLLVDPRFGTSRRILVIVAVSGLTFGLFGGAAGILLGLFAPTVGAGHGCHRRRRLPTPAEISRQDPRRQPARLHRRPVQELRTLGAGALPGQALVVLDPRLMLVTDVVLCEDGHAQERSLLESVLPMIDARMSGSTTATSARRRSSRDRGAAGVHRHATTRLDAAIEVRRQATAPRPDRDRGGLRADDPCQRRLGRDPRPASDHGGAGPADAGRGSGDPSADQPAATGRPGRGDRRVAPEALDDRDGLRGIGRALDGEVTCWVGCAHPLMQKDGVR